jgi:hypothetical protein
MFFIIIAWYLDSKFCLIACFRQLQVKATMMLNTDQQKMLDELAKQKQNQARVDRILKFVLPIMGFLIAVMCANFNRFSTIATIVVTILVLWMVGIKRQPLWIWTTFAAIYCLMDNLYSFPSFNINKFAIQFGTITTFMWITGVGRPYIDRWLMKSEEKNQ